MAKKKNPPIDSSTTPDEPKNTKKRTKKSKSETMDDLTLVSNKKEDEEQTVHYCSICGRATNEVQCMVSNKDESFAVCSDCLENMTAIAQARIAQINGDLQAFRKIAEEAEEEGDVIFNSNIPTPHEIKDYLDQYVIGQDDAKITLSVAVYNHYKRIMQNSKKDEDDVTLEKNNILICGNSGSGKTFLCKTIANMLDVPCISVDITSFSASGYVGDDVESIISRLYAASGNDVKKTEIGICIIDEFDKLGRHGAGANITRDVNGIDVQQGLLKLLEGTEVMIEPNGGRRHPEAEMIKINTSGILFICLGRFNGIEEVIGKRLNQNQMGFDLTNGKTESGEIIDQQNIVRYAEADDFKKLGLIQEIVGRLPVITYVNPLTRKDLKRILIEPKNSIIKQYKKLFELSGKQLIIKDDVYDYIVERGFKADTGARGLRTIVERILKQKMFDAPSENAQDASNDVLIDMDYVKKIELKNFIDPAKKIEIEKKKKMII